MGCCFSRPDGPNSPYPGGIVPSSSVHPINAPPASSHRRPSVSSPNSSSTPGAADPASPASPGSRRRSRHIAPGQLAQHINKPLRRHVWTAKRPPPSSGANVNGGGGGGPARWTPRILSREREDFFDTRVTGRQEIWQTIRTALEVMWAAEAQARSASGSDAGPDDEHRPDIALATAQTMLSAADITLPTGDLAQGGAYDAFGNYYQLPEWIVAGPINTAEDADEGDVPAAAKRSRHHSHSSGAGQKDEEIIGDTKADMSGSGDDEDVDSDEAERRREEKGKGVVDEREQVSVCARLSETGRDVAVYIGKDETVRSLSRKITEESGITPDKKIRIAYMGKILRETSSLSSQGWKQGHVVNALVFDSRR